DPDNDDRVDWWDLETGLRVPVPGPLGQVTNVLYHDLLPDGVTAWTYASLRADWQDVSELTPWDGRPGGRGGDLAGPGVRPSPRDSSWIQLGADSRTLALARDRTMWLYDVPSRSLRGEVRTTTVSTPFAFHPAGRLMAFVVSKRRV